MPTRICLQLLLCLGHYATHSLDQRRIAIDAPRFQEMANFQHQPVNLRISTGQSTEPEAEPKRAFYVDRSLATGHWINKVCNGGRRPWRIDRILNCGEVRSCQPVKRIAYPGVRGQNVA